MIRLYSILVCAVPPAMIAVAPGQTVNSRIPSTSVLAAGAGSFGVSGGGRVAGASPIIAVAPVVTLTPPPMVRVQSLEPPTSAPSVLANSSFNLEIWGSSVSNPSDGLACVYTGVQLQPPEAIHATAPAQDSPLFSINAVPTIFDGDVIDDAGGCQTVPAIIDLGVDEWVLIKTISMNATAVLGPVNISLQPGGNVFAGASIIGNVNIVNAPDITYHIAVVDVVCESGELTDLAAVAAFQNCFAIQGAKGVLGPACDQFDTDCDLDTDLQDYTGLVETLYGP